MKLQNLDLEIAKNPNCQEFKARRLKVLEDLYDKTRAEIVQASAELHRYKKDSDRCADCMRCDLHKEFV